MTLRAKGAWLVVGLLAGCDGVGRALVDRTETPPVEAGLACGVRPACHAPVMRWESPPPRVREPACPLGPVETIDATELARRTSCQCQHLRVVLDQPPTAEAVVRNLIVSDCIVEVAATGPASLRLEQMNATGLSVTLEGPVQLTIADRASLSSTSISAASDGVDARVTLVETAAQNLEVEVADTRVARSHLQASRLLAPSLSLESALIESSTLDSNALVAIDVRFESLEIRTNLGSLSAARGAGLMLTGCGAFLIAGSELEQSQLGPCDSMLRVYDSRIESSLLSGAVESDGSDIAGSRLGVGAATRLTAWETVISSTALCEGATALRLAGVTIECSVCEGPLDETEGDVCSRGGPASVAAFKNECASLEGIEDCTSPFPRRGRP